ncbi:MAG: uroporphyrinogen-III C-methyltransferase [Vicinamibacterales bacterium]
MRPTVYIIGAGPGAPDLISVRGLRALQSAQVVIYDSRVQPRLLDLASPTSERIDVGSAAPQSAEQDAINFLIAEKAREGHVVARLKWGDPFVFDRGGSEALFLHEQGIAFEVVPGVTALVASPAFAGIPITYPGAGDSLTFVRGFEDEGRTPPKVDWASLARLDGTIACFTGPRQVPHVVGSLLAHGRPPEESAALVLHGTLSSQRTVTAPLGEIAAKVQEQDVSSAGILVTGSVVGLRDHLRWFDNRPLFGRRVLVTRSRDQAPELVELLEQNGAEAIEAPVLRIAPPLDRGPLERAAAAPRSFDWIVLTSANAAAALIGCVLAESRDLRALAGPRLCAVGPGTAARLQRYGVSPDLQPADHRNAGIIAAIADNGSLRGLRVLLPTSDSGTETLGDDLRAAGAEVTEVTAYRATTVESDAHLGLYGQLLDRRIDAVTFTSATTVRAFVEIYGTEQAPDLLSGTVVATIGPAAADAAARAGITVHVITQGATVAALVDGLIRHFHS